METRRERTRDVRWPRSTPIRRHRARRSSVRGESAHRGTTDGATVEWFVEAHRRRDGWLPVGPPSVGDSVERTSTPCEVCGQSESVRCERPEKRGGRSKGVPVRAVLDSLVRKRCSAPEGYPETGYCRLNWQRGERGIELDDFRCVVCGLSRSKRRETYSRNVHVRHVVPIRDFRPEKGPNRRESNQASDLVVLRSSCYADSKRNYQSFSSRLTHHPNLMKRIDDKDEIGRTRRSSHVE